MNGSPRSPESLASPNSPASPNSSGPSNSSGPTASAVSAVSAGPAVANSIDERERGSGTVIAVGVAGLIASLLVLGLLLAGAVLAVHRARSAADLAAIGAARTVLLGGDQARACREADSLVRANDAQMDSCSVRGDDVTVDASVQLPSALRPLGHTRATARAKAGPE